MCRFFRQHSVSYFGKEIAKMKYSMIALACVLAVASAQYQYTTIRPLAYNRPWAAAKNEASRSVFNTPLTATLRPLFASQSSYTARPVYSSTPFPARSVFPSASPAPVKPELSAQPAPTPATTFELSATPSPATWSASAAPEVAEVSVVPAVRVAAPPAAPVVQEASVVSFTPVVAQESPVYTAAKIASLPVPRYASNARGAETLKFVNQMNSNGAYDYAYETNNGIVMQAQGSPRSFYSGEDAVSPVVSQGSFAWISPEGREISMTYFADENGYHPSGSAIPVAPEIPPLIARSLEYIKSLQKTPQ